MTAYVSADGNIRVELAGRPAPDGFSAKPHASFDTKLIELQERLDDIAGDLAHGCADEDLARTLIQGELVELDLTGWMVETDPDRPIDEVHPCTRVNVHGEEQRLVLRGEQGASAPRDDPYHQFARALDEKLEATCSTLPEAEAAAEQVAAATDVSALTDVAFDTDGGLLHIDSIEDPTASCTRASVTVGGRVQVTLRGPTA